MSEYDTVDALPLYTRHPKPLPPRSIPVCSHRHLDYTFFSNLLFEAENRHGTYLLEPCASSPTCTQRPTIQVTPSYSNSNNRPALFLITTYPIAKTATPTSCPLSTLQKSFNRTRIANILRNATIRICPHLQLSDPEVAGCFSATAVAHTDLQGKTQGDAGFTGACCADDRPGRRPKMHSCGACVRLGFVTAFQFVSVERRATKEVPVPHVELQVLVSVRLGGFEVAEDKSADLEWPAHSLADDELVGWHIGFGMLLGSVGDELFWYPWLPHRLCPERGAWMRRRIMEAAEREAVAEREKKAAAERREREAARVAAEERRRGSGLRLVFPVRTKRRQARIVR